jgi:hypothetical protein
LFCGGDDGQPPRYLNRPVDFAPLVVHFEEEEVSQLLNVIAIGKAIIAENRAVVPEALHDGG